jgi:hypothetical protein
MIREIRSASWKDFCRRVSRQQHGGALNIAVEDAQGRMLETVTGLVFDGLSLDTSRACNNVLSVRAANEHSQTLEIIEPIYILLRQSSDHGDYNPVEIRAENGKTILTFHPAIHQDLLSGLQVF